jgi:hypothetical protein
MSDVLVFNTESNSAQFKKPGDMTYSGCKQDLFPYYMTKKKTDGYFIDIGSAHSSHYNNSYLLEKSLDWIGICVEFESKYNYSYQDRSCTYLNEDATKIDYKKLFEDNFFPSSIDYLSLDVDDVSNTVLNILPFDDYKFKCITIEHDYYLTGDKFRKEQRDFLTSKGYYLLFGDIYVEMQEYPMVDCAFEDWWIHKDSFDMEKVSKITKEKLYPSEAIELIKKEML